MTRSPSHARHSHAAMLAWIVLLVACTSSPARDEVPSASRSASAPASRVASPTVSAAPTPAIAIELVTADWTRAIEAEIASRDVSVTVGAGDRILFAHAGAEPRIPASNQKLLTSAAALELFGSNHRFVTEVAARHPLRDGRIRGDLWLVGSGDPEVNAATMTRLADAVRAAGVTGVTGGVVGDTSAFSREWWAPGWVPGLSRSYVTRTTALAFDGNVGSGLPEAAAAASLTSALRSVGIEVAADPVVGEAPRDLVPLARTRSRPLRTLLAVQNHGSVNFYAETLLKAIGTSSGGAEDSTAAGAAAVAAWAASMGVSAQVMDGSGLSHQDLVSTDGIVTVLLLAQDERWGGALDASLAPPGAGTLEGRLIGVPVSAKTGTLFETPVSALSGYVTDLGGNRVAFSVISRGLDKSTAVGIEDAIVRLLADAQVAS